MTPANQEDWIVRALPRLQVVRDPAVMSPAVRDPAVISPAARDPAIVDYDHIMRIDTNPIP